MHRHQGKQGPCNSQKESEDRLIKDQGPRLQILGYTSPGVCQHSLGPITKEDISRIEEVQRRATRFLLHRHHNASSVDDMLQNLDWPTFEQRRKLARLAIVYKACNILANVYSPQVQLQPRSRGR